jgi:hypothetical protein
MSDIPVARPRGRRNDGMMTAADGDKSEAAARAAATTVRMRVGVLQN